MVKKKQIVIDGLVLPGCNAPVWHEPITVQGGEIFCVYAPEDDAAHDLGRLLVGLDKAKPGTVSRPKKTVYLPHTDEVEGSMKVWEILGTALAKRKVSESEAIRQIMEVLSPFGSDAEPDDQFGSLSPETALGVVTAFVKLQEGDAIVAFEPGSGMSSPAATDQFNMLSEAANAGAPVVVITTRGELAVALSARIAFMHDGRFHDIGTAEELVARHCKHDSLVLVASGDVTVNDLGAGLDKRVRSVRRTDAGYEMELDDSMAVLPLLFAHMRDRGVQLEAVMFARANLVGAFQNLTGMMLD